MSFENIRKELEQIQDVVDEKYAEYAKIEFTHKLEHHNSIKALLEKRDAILEKLSKPEWNEFFSNAVNSFDAITDMFPQNSEGEFDTSIVKSIKVDFLENFHMRVLIELYENSYIENTILEKNYDLFGNDESTIEIKYKDESKACELFEYFEVDGEKLDTFEAFYELYCNLTFYTFFTENPECAGGCLGNCNEPCSDNCHEDCHEKEENKE